MTGLMSLTIALPPTSHCWISSIVKRFRGTMIRIMQSEKGGRNGYIYQLFEIITPWDLDELLQVLKQEQPLKDIRIAVSKRGRIYGSAKAMCASGCPLMNLNCAFLRSVTSGMDGEVYWHFIGTSSDCRSIMRELTNKGVLYRVAELKIIRGDGEMTGKQELVVRVAFDLGYFDYPKRINIRELAAVLHISPATLCEELRRGLKKILGQYFSDMSVIELANKHRHKEAILRQKTR